VSKKNQRNLRLKKHAGATVPDHDRTEFAEEATPFPNIASESIQNAEAETEPQTASRTLGYIALTSAIASLFVWPAFLGSFAALFGFFAYIQGSRSLGMWSIVIGLISLAGFFLLVPMYA
jgi:hypothetical protein